MAPRKNMKKGRKSKPRRQWKKGGMSRATRLVNNALQPFPQNFVCKMKYAADVNTTAGGSYIMNLNSVFDPDQTGVGHQPYGFDNLATLYNRYRVISCGWRITTTSGSSSVVQLGSFATNQGISPVNFAELKEQPRAKYICQLPGAGASVLRGKVHIPSLVGRSKSQYMADDRYQALVSANPQELALLQIYTANNVGVFASYVINIQLEYTVEFFDVNNVAQS